jgi:hypothetical protein
VTFSGVYVNASYGGIEARILHSLFDQQPTYRLAVQHRHEERILSEDQQERNRTWVSNLFLIILVGSCPQTRDMLKKLHGGEEDGGNRVMVSSICMYASSIQN